MWYAILTLVHERQRYFAGVLAVAFSAVLIALQFGSLIGLVSTVSAPVDLSAADIWIAAQNTASCDGGQLIDKRWRNHLALIESVVATDEFVQAFHYWKHPSVGSVLCIVAGCNLDPETGLGPHRLFTAEQRLALTEPGAVILDGRDSRRLGITKLGEKAEVYGRRVRVVGFVENMGSMTGPYVFCSLATARRLLQFPPDKTIYVLGKCRTPEDIPAVVEQLRENREVTVFSREQFSLQSRMYWITTTKAGIAVAFVAGLGLVVGTVVTSQTLYAATMALLKELAVLRALGIPRWRINLFVVQQSLAIGILGLCAGTPVAFGLAELAAAFGTRLDLPSWLLAITAVVTLMMSLISGCFALRPLRRVDPAELLR